MPVAYQGASCADHQTGSLATQTRGCRPTPDFGVEAIPTPRRCRRPLPDVAGSRYLGFMATDTIELNEEQSWVYRYRFRQIVHLIAVLSATTVAIGAVVLQDCSPDRYGGTGSFKPGPLAYGAPWGLGNLLGVVAMVCVLVVMFMALPSVVPGQRWWEGLAHLATAICIFLGHAVIGLSYTYDRDC